MPSVRIEVVFANYHEVYYISGISFKQFNDSLRFSSLSKEDGLPGNKTECHLYRMSR